MALGVIPELIDDHATEHPDRHIRLAAQVVRAMRTEDRGAFNDAIVQTINRPNGSGRLIVAVSDLYSFILPELATPSGRRSLSEWAVTIASYEKGDE